MLEKAICIRKTKTITVGYYAGKQPLDSKPCFMRLVYGAIDDLKYDGRMVLSDRAILWFKGKKDNMPDSNPLLHQTDVWIDRGLQTLLVQRKARQRTRLETLLHKERSDSSFDRRPVERA